MIVVSDMRKVSDLRSVSPFNIWVHEHYIIFFSFCQTFFLLFSFTCISIYINMLVYIVLYRLVIYLSYCIKLITKTRVLSKIPYLYHTAKLFFSRAGSFIEHRKRAYGSQSGLPIRDFWGDCRILFSFCGSRFVCSQGSGGKRERRGGGYNSSFVFNYALLIHINILTVVCAVIIPLIRYIFFIHPIPWIFIVPLP